MKKFALISKDDEVSIKLAQTLQKRLIDLNMQYDDQNPDIVCVVGGDGTFLSSVHKYINQLDKVTFTGIHTGTLGFFADYTLKELNEWIDDIANKEPVIDEKSMIQIEMGSNIYYAVNEMRLESMRTQYINVFLNDNKFEGYRGSGICLSTQTGSTAFNRSLGGAIVMPDVEVMQLTEHAGVHHQYCRSLNNPLIIGKNTTVRFNLNEYEYSNLCFDRYIINVTTHDIICKLSDKKVRIARFREDNWIKHVEPLFY